MVGLRLLQGFVDASNSLAEHLGRTSGRPSHLELGRRGEEAAFFYLRRLGFIIVARDWRSGKAPGDLDLIGWENETLCFVEVKTRSSHAVATAEAAVDTDKMRALRRLARQYLLATPHAPDQTRFDILSIYFETDQSPQLELFRGAFDWHTTNDHRPH